MDRIINMKTDKQAIYEIYRACRLCGGGAGYKMPIVQTVIDLDNNGVDLKHKIQECLQIKVHQDDKMPPLICELCVDKVNDFYDFMEMCKLINKRTRLRLGLPAQTTARSNASSDSGDCILGVTEPIYVPDDDENQPLSKSVKVKNNDSSKKNEKSVKKKVKVEKVKVKKEKESEVKVKVEKIREPSPEVRRTRISQNKRDPTPPRARSTRHSVGSADDNDKISSLKRSSKSSSSSSKSSPPKPRSTLMKELQELMILADTESPRTKRAREKEPVPEKKPDVPSKKVKVAVQPPKQSLPKPRPKSKRAASPAAPPARPPPPLPPPPPPPPPAAPARRPASPKRKRALSPQPAVFPCSICGSNHKSAQGVANHIRTHVVTFTNPKLACDPCREWFSTADESSVHHRKHKYKPYSCRHCYDTFKTLVDYDNHFEKDNCQPYYEVPDKKCDECWRTYATQNLLDQHRCQGPDGRPGGKCNKCNRLYTLLKNLKKHEITCTFRKKGEAIIDPEVEKQLKHTQIRVTRCDDLLTKIKGECYDVSDVDNDFGFDSSCVYPYRYRIKSEPTTGYNTMVTIGDEIKQEYYAKNYIHWDSDDSDSDSENKIHSLTTLTLKTIFSSKVLGKVPRKRRRIKRETFDNTDFDMSKDIDSIIDNLGKSDDFKDSANDSDCSESIFGPFNNKNDFVNDSTFDNVLGSQDNERNLDTFNDSSQGSQSLISSMKDNDLDLNNVSMIKDVSNENEDIVRSDDKNDESSKIVTKDEAICDSSIVDNVQSTDLNKSESNDTLQENERLESNEQSKNEESTSVGNSVSDNVNGETDSNNVEHNTEESAIKVNGQIDNHLNDLDNEKDNDSINENNDEGNSVEVNDRLSNDSIYKNNENGSSVEVNDRLSNDSINENNEKGSSVELNDRLSHENKNGDPKNETNCDVAKENNEGFSEKNVNVDSLRSEKDIITIDDIVPKGNKLKEMDLDSISDEEFNFDA